MKRIASKNIGTQSAVEQWTSVRCFFSGRRLKSPVQIIAAILFIVLALAALFCGCSDDDDNGNDDNEPETECYTQVLEIGWNLVSVSFVPETLSSSIIFKDVIFGPLQFNNDSQRYSVPETIDVNYGYWVFVDSIIEMELCGEPLTRVVLYNMSIGYALIGSPCVSVPVDDVLTDPAGIIDSVFTLTYYDSIMGTCEYETVDSLLPCIGYWIFLTEDIESLWINVP